MWPVCLLSYDLLRMPGLRVGILTKGELSQSATIWAQGGVAAVIGGDEDSTDLHLADTLAAGAGLCDDRAVSVLVDEGPLRVRELIGLGAVFDSEASGSWQVHAKAATPSPGSCTQAAPPPAPRWSGRSYAAVRAPPPRSSNGGSRSISR